MFILHLFQFLPEIDFTGTYVHTTNNFVKNTLMAKSHVTISVQSLNWYELKFHNTTIN